MGTMGYSSNVTGNARFLHHQPSGLLQGHLFSGSLQSWGPEQGSELRELPIYLQNTDLQNCYPKARR